MGRIPNLKISLFILLSSDGNVMRALKRETLGLTKSILEGLNTFSKPEMNRSK